MEKPFRKLKGNRIYLELPELKKGKIILTDAAVKEMYETIKNKERFKVYAVGESVMDLKEGDEVRVDNMGLARSEVVKLSEELSVLQISMFDISHVW